MHDTMWYF